VLVLALPVVLANTVRGPADSDAVAADSGGGVQGVPHRLAPAFDLVDQRGQRISTQQLRGKLVVLTFLDPVCTSDCPVIANQLAIADRDLGVLSGEVEFIAIDSNPVFYRVADVAAFTDSHGLSDLPNWHFLTGPVETTQDTLARYGITVEVPTVGMIEHSEGLFFITADGRLAAYLDDRANAELTDTYAEQVQRQIRDLLP
jgi:cytochrome oxidase Cu insertion factor (SCO1/SenC/PrrC family)